MKLKTYNACKECSSCADLFFNGQYYCNMKRMDPKNSQIDISVCKVDPETKPDDCPWDELNKTVESFSPEDQIGIRCMAKMFGGEGVKDWFVEDNNNNITDSEKVIKGLEALYDAMRKNQCYACSHEFIEVAENFGTEIVAEAIDLLKRVFRSA